MLRKSPLTVGVRTRFVTSGASVNTMPATAPRAAIPGRIDGAATVVASVTTIDQSVVAAMAAASDRWRRASGSVTAPAAQISAVAKVLALSRGWRMSMEVAETE
jgi:hypothetical protein